jgi:hypothetical protein
MFASESSTSFPAASAVPPGGVLVHELKRHYRRSVERKRKKERKQGQNAKVEIGWRQARNGQQSLVNCLDSFLRALCARD